ncbi:MAG: hypothetical protein ACTSXG_00820 [Alphaproteobacteria bacterium]
MSIYAMQDLDLKYKQPHKQSLLKKKEIYNPLTQQQDYTIDIEGCAENCRECKYKLETGIHKILINPGVFDTFLPENDMNIGMTTLGSEEKYHAYLIVAINSDHHFGVVANMTLNENISCFLEYLAKSYSEYGINRYLHARLCVIENSLNEGINDIESFFNKHDKNNKYKKTFDGFKEYIHDLLRKFVPNNNIGIEKISINESCDKYNALINTSIIFNPSKFFGRSVDNESSVLHGIDALFKNHDRNVVSYSSFDPVSCDILNLREISKKEEYLFYNEKFFAVSNILRNNDIKKIIKILSRNGDVNPEVAENLGHDKLLELMFLNGKYTTMRVDHRYNPLFLYYEILCSNLSRYVPPEEKHSCHLLRFDAVHGFFPTTKKREKILKATASENPYYTPLARNFYPSSFFNRYKISADSDSMWKSLRTLHLTHIIPELCFELKKK